MVKPLYEHDCNVCKFHGHYVNDRGIFDLYTCDSLEEVELIARFGNDGPEYICLDLDTIERSGKRNNPNYPLAYLYRLLKAKEKAIA